MTKKNCMQGAVVIIAVMLMFVLAYVSKNGWSFTGSGGDGFVATFTDLQNAIDGVTGVELGDGRLGYAAMPDGEYGIVTTTVNSVVTVNLNCSVVRTGEEGYVTVTSGKEVILELNGKMVDAVGSDYCILVDGSMTLNDSSEDKSGVICGGKVDCIRLQGILVMNGGTIQGKSELYTESHGVYVNSSNAIFTMNGGKITGHKATNGAGVYVSLGKEFNLNGGEISNNVASSLGGAVYIDSSSLVFTMKDGNISYNRAIGRGGAIYLKSRMLIEGGQIYSNQARSGGAIYAASGSNIEMSNGKIFSNRAVSNSSNTFGGAICLDSTMTLSGGEISENESDYIGGAIYISDSSFAKLEMSSGIVCKNKSDGDGGGIYIALVCLM